MSTKILFNNPDGTQTLTEVGEGGAVPPSVTVIWDERRDGPFLTQWVVLVGGLVKSGNTLTLDAALKSTNDVKAAAVIAAQTAAVNLAKAAVTRLQAVDTITDLAGAKIVLKDMAAIIIRIIQKDAQ